MKRPAIAVLLLLIAPLLVKAQAGLPSAPEMSYDSVPNFLKLPPHLYLGEAASVAVNSKGHVFVFSRSGHTQLLEFDPAGNFLRLIGDDLWGFSFGHSVKVDKHDNIWTVDEGANVVVKFNPKGEVDLVIGRRVASTVSTQPGAPQPIQPGVSSRPDASPSLYDYFERTFHRPTDVAWGLNGEIYVSDGYVNSRVEKYDQDGNFMKEWGQKGTGPGEFRVPHSIATDAKGNVYVADSGNGRIQIFDADGNFLKQWTNVNPAVLCITPPPNQVLFVIGNVMTSRPVYKLDMDGKVLGVISHPDKKLSVFHGMACPSNNLLFLADVQNWRVVKMILHPIQ
jgi:hypothetical protein